MQTEAPQTSPTCDGSKAAVQLPAVKSSSRLRVPPLMLQQSRTPTAFSVARAWADRVAPQEWHKLRSLWRVLAPYWLDASVRWEALRGAAAVVGLTFANTLVMLNTTFFNSLVLKAVAEKDRRGFYRSLLLHLMNVVFGVPCTVLQEYFQARLAMKWRAWMTSKFLDKYFVRRKYYEIQSAGQLDNPDQRINDDIRNCTVTALAASQMVLGAALDFSAFSAILLAMYPPMFFALVAFAAGGTRVSLWLGQKLIGLNFLREQHEADFRFALVRVRENAESIAFYKGERGERELLLQRLYAVLRNTAKTQAVTRNLGFFTQTYSYLVKFIPFLVAAPAYFQGSIDFAFVNQCAEVFNHITGDASLVIFQAERLADFCATVNRLDEFIYVLEARPSSSAIMRKAAEPSTLLGVEGLSVETPDQRVLFHDLDFQLSAGESLLIMGPSGCGKTSLMRVIAGLWDLGSGTVQSQVESKETAGVPLPLLFLPQRPYMVLGSLRDQMLYPTWAAGQLQLTQGARDAPEEVELESTLQAVRLSHLLQRDGGFDNIADWSAVLSLGEQQRLALTRVLLARPALALLDECTSAVDEECEGQIYALLRNSGTAFVSVSHRSSLRGLHSKLLDFSTGASAEAGSAWALHDGC